MYRFFTSKLCRVAAEVAARMSTTAAISVALPLRPSQVAMDTLHAVSSEEVVRLIRLCSTTQVLSTGLSTADCAAERSC